MLTGAVPSRVAGLLLAAGAGTRIGVPKALLVIGGEPLAARGVRALANGGCDPVVVVLGAAADRVLATTRLPPAIPTVNRRWADGQGGSLRAGLAAVERVGPEATACVVLLVDTPGVGAEAVRRIGAAADERSAVVATYGGRRGHPVALGRTLWAEVAASAVGDVGARALLAAQPEVVREVACDDVGTPEDIDTPEQLASYLTAHGRPAAGSPSAEGQQ